MASNPFILTIRVTRTIRYRGGRSIPKGAVLAAKPSPFGDGWDAAHFSGIEGTYAHVSHSDAEVVA